MSVRPEESEKSVKQSAESPQARGEALVDAGRTELTNPALKKPADLKGVVQTNGALVIDDPYSFYQGAPDSARIAPEANKTLGDVKKTQSDAKPEGDPQAEKFAADIQKALDANIAAFKQELTESNFKLGFGRNDGPEQALLKMKHAAEEKAHSGKELSSQERAIAGMSNDQIHKEAMRIRDRDFKEMKTEDGKARHWYTTRDTPSRYSSEEMDKLLQAKEKELTKQAEEAQQMLGRK